MAHRSWWIRDLQLLARGVLLFIGVVIATVSVLVLAVYLFAKTIEWRAPPPPAAVAPHQLRAMPLDCPVFLPGRSDRTDLHHRPCKK